MEAKALIDQLNAFADADSVKEYLKLMGVKGFRENEMNCPISNWIRYNTDCPVMTEDKIIVFTGYDWDNDVDEFETSEAVKQFIRNFDVGDYPELEDEYEEFDF